jgi:hypothetical protein
LTEVYSSPKVSAGIASRLPNTAPRTAPAAAAEQPERRHEVKTHVTRILSKLGLRDRAQAIVAAYESGLVEPGAGALRSDP